MGILDCIKKLVCQLAGREKPLKKVSVTPSARTLETMPTGTKVKIGNDEYPVYYENGSRKTPHILAGNTFVPLSIFKSVLK